MKSTQTFNICIATNNLPDMSIEALVKAAEQAIYRVKRQRKYGFDVNESKDLITVELIKS